MTYEIKWTIEKIKNGFEEYLKINGQYPTALDIDKYGLLPSSRQIQRRFGGLKKLRESLGFPSETIDFTRGESRSKMAEKTWKRGIDLERDLYNSLVSKFGEIFVHAQKPFNNYKGRVDFFVYCKNYKFGVDVFFADELHSLVGCINTKQRTYNDVDFDVIFLSSNPDIKQEIIDKFVKNKANRLSPNIKVLNLENFQNFINRIEPLDVKYK